MGGAQQGGFISLRHRHLGDHAPAEQHDCAVASERNFWKLGSEQQHCRSRSRYFSDQRVDLALRTNVDAASGIKTKQDIKTAGEPARDNDLLLVAAALLTRPGCRSGGVRLRMLHAFAPREP
jgi:hypothetical protein